MITWLLGGRRSLENPAVSLSDPKALEMLGGQSQSSAGVGVTHRKALTVAAVWQAVSMISGDVAKLPLSLYKRLPDDGREVARAHPAHVIVRRRAGDHQAAFAFWRQVMADALLWGNGYAWIRYRPDGLTPVELVPLLPDRTCPYSTDSTVFYATEAGGKQVFLRPDEVLHIRGLTTTRDAHLSRTESGDVSVSMGAMCGADLVAYAKESIGLALAAEGFNAKFFRNGARSAGILEVPNSVSKTAADTIEEGFRKFHDGPDNWFKTVVLRDGAKFHQISFSAKDAETHQLREDQVRDVARFFNLAPSRLGLSDSVSYNSKAEDNQSYLDTTLSVWLETITAECWLKLLRPSEQGADSHYFEHNTAALLRMNAKDRAEMYHYGILDGWMNRNQVRRLENQPAAEGLDEFLVPVNMMAASKLGQVAPVLPPSPRADVGAEQAESTKVERSPQSRARRRAVVLLADHARKKAASGSSFTTWVDDGLSWHRSNWEQTVGAGVAEFFDPLLQRLNELLESTAEAGLPEAVDRLFTAIEDEEGI